MKRLAVVLVLLLPTTATALSFTEDFESYALGGLSPVTKPDQNWYNYRDANDKGNVSNDSPDVDSQWLLVQAEPLVEASPIRFELTAPTQLTNISFSIAGRTPADDERGSRQKVLIESTAPRRTLAQFFVFCDDPSNPSACEFRVRFANVDTTGQVLINTTVGDSRFDVSIVPDWSTATYRLYVNGVDDGVFPFLDLPSNVGRISIAQSGSFYPMAVSFDNLFIDGAAEPPGGSGKDVATFLQDFAEDIHFTSSVSLFLLGLIFLIDLWLALALGAMAVGRDNTILPATAFFGALAVLWLVYLEWWPESFGIALIIVVAALVGLVVRRHIMGIQDASTNAGIVAGSLGYFIIASALLGFSGYAADSIELPTSSLDTPEDEEAQTNETAARQSFGVAVVECIAAPIVSAFASLGQNIEFDCSRDTKSTTFAQIENVLSTIFNFARTAFSFLFQLLTFQLPISPVFNVIIILPPASSLATVGFGFITRSGS